MSSSTARAPARSGRLNPQSHAVSTHASHPQLNLDRNAPAYVPQGTPAVVPTSTSVPNSTSESPSGSRTATSTTSTTSTSTSATPSTRAAPIRRLGRFPPRPTPAPPHATLAIPPDEAKSPDTSGAAASSGALAAAAASDAPTSQIPQTRSVRARPKSSVPTSSTLSTGHSRVTHSGSSPEGDAAIATGMSNRSGHPRPRSFAAFKAAGEASSSLASQVPEERPGIFSRFRLNRSNHTHSSHIQPASTEEKTPSEEKASRNDDFLRQRQVRGSRLTKLRPAAASAQPEPEVGNESSNAETPNTQKVQLKISAKNRGSNSQTEAPDSQKAPRRRGKRDRTQGKAPNETEVKVPEDPIVLPSCFQEYANEGVVARTDEAQRLRTQLLELQQDSLECTICIEPITRSHATWSCQQCYHIFHLSCTQDWFRLRFQRAAANAAAREAAQNARTNAIASRRQRIVDPRTFVGPETAVALAARAAAEETTRNAPSSFESLVNELHRTNEDDSWPCPMCTVMVTTPPSKYLCYCGQTESPRMVSLALPHGCAKTCNKLLGVPGSGCTHRCVLQCHPGPCPPCPALGDTKRCGCGRNTYVLRCGKVEARPRSCGETCGQPLRTAPIYGGKLCGHACDKVCHGGSCGACTRHESQDCFCGRQTNVQHPCGSSFEFAQADNLASFAANTKDKRLHFSCGTVCDKILDCGAHHCQIPCHPGACPPCKFMSLTKCACGGSQIQELNPKTVFERLMTGDTLRQKFEDRCREDGLSFSEDDYERKASIIMSLRACTDPLPLCGSVCGRKLPKCEHSCMNPCHEGECAPCGHPGEPTSCRCQRNTVVALCPESLAGKAARAKELIEMRSQPADSAERSYASFFDAADPRNAGQRVPPMNFPPDMPTCSHMCRQVLSCGLHRCNTKCCTDSAGYPISGIRSHVCPRKCDQLCACGRHYCNSPCHGTKPCPPCTFVYTDGFTCPCGTQNIPGRVRCVDLRAHCESMCDRKFLARLPRMNIRFGNLLKLWFSQVMASKVKANDTTVAPRPPFVGPYWATYVPHPPNYLLLPNETVGNCDQILAEGVAIGARSLFAATSPFTIPGSGLDGDEACEHTCRDSIAMRTCRPCAYQKSKPCIGGHGVWLAAMCGQPRPSCGAPCLKRMACGHVCVRPCHGGPCLEPSSLPSMRTVAIAEPTPYSLPSLQMVRAIESCLADKAAGSDLEEKVPEDELKAAFDELLQIKASAESECVVPQQHASEQAIAQLAVAVREDMFNLDPAYRPIGQFSGALAPNLPMSYPYTNASYATCAKQVWDRSGATTNLVIPISAPPRDVVLCCARQCEKVKPACSHKCQLPCHPGILCPSDVVPCKEYVLRKCLCGRIEQRVQCALVDKFAPILQIATTPSLIQDFLSFAQQAQETRKSGLEIEYVESEIKSETLEGKSDATVRPIPTSNDSWDDDTEPTLKVNPVKSTHKINCSRAYLDFLATVSDNNFDEAEKLILELPTSVIPLPCDLECSHRKRVKALMNAYAPRGQASSASAAGASDLADEPTQNPYSEEELTRILATVSTQFVAAVEEIFKCIVRKQPIPMSNMFVTKATVAILNSAAAAAATTGISDEDLSQIEVAAASAQAESAKLASRVLTAFSFPPMNRGRRSVVHLIAAYYNLYSVSLDQEPSRTVRVEYTPQAIVPVVTLTRGLELYERSRGQIRLVSPAAQALQSVLSKPPTPRFAFYIYNLVPPGVSAQDALINIEGDSTSRVITIQNLSDMLLPWEGLYGITSIMRHTALVRVGLTEVRDDMISSLLEHGLLERVPYRPTGDNSSTPFDAFVIPPNVEFLWAAPNFTHRFQTPQMHEAFVFKREQRLRAISHIRAARAAILAAPAVPTVRPDPVSFPRLQNAVNNDDPEDESSDPEFNEALRQAKNASRETFRLENGHSL